MPCWVQCAAHTASAQASPRQPRSQLHTPMWLQFPWPEHESTQEGQPGVAMAVAERNMAIIPFLEPSAAKEKNARASPHRQRGILRRGRGGPHRLYSSKIRQDNVVPFRGVPARACSTPGVCVCVGVWVGGPRWAPLAGDVRDARDRPSTPCTMYHVPVRSCVSVSAFSKARGPVSALKRQASAPLEAAQSRGRGLHAIARARAVRCAAQGHLCLFGPVRGCCLCGAVLGCDAALWRRWQASRLVPSQGRLRNRWHRLRRLRRG